MRRALWVIDSMNSKISRLKVAHIVQDEKFPDSAFDLFERCAPSISDFYLPDKRRPIKHLKKIRPIRVSKFSFLNPFFTRKLAQYDAVILHGLTSFNIELVARSKKSVPFVWIGMGFDYYDLLCENADKLIKPKTALLIDAAGCQYSEKKIKVLLRKLLKKVVYAHASKKIEIVSRITLFAPVLESEYLFMKEAYPDETPEYIDWNYAATAPLIEGNSHLLGCKGTNILIGNSATPTNNHIDTFDIVKGVMDIGDAHLFVPLSYGDKNYREVVKTVGMEMFGGRFHPIIDFMNYSDYMNMVSSCSVVIMNHKRQQAGANIAAALFMGARVFLDPDNGFYRDYMYSGVKIHDLSDLVKDPSLAYRPLTAHEKEKNRDILRKMRGWDALYEKTENLLVRISEL
ncbi:hypothetical protein CEK62_04175 [Alcanivorax sp. N3-2A]|nr:hypothetical protein CEK62_04175 [Alcanivorax sp. N3-2A]